LAKHNIVEMMSTNRNNLTVLLDKNILSQKKKKVSKAPPLKCAEKSTAASRNNQTDKTDSSCLERRIIKMEKEMHARFRLLEERLTARVENVEKRASAIESDRVQNSQANSELLKRVHISAKEEIQGVQDALEGMQTAVTKNTSDQDKTHEVISKMKNNRLVTHSFEARLKAAEQRLDSIDIADGAVPPFRYKSSTKPVTDTGRSRSRSPPPTLPKRQLPPPPPVVSTTAALVPPAEEELAATEAANAAAAEIAVLKRKVRECEHVINTSVKLTQEALTDQKAAVLFLFRQSNIVTSANMNSEEVDAIFNTLGESTNVNNGLSKAKFVSASHWER